MSDIVERLRADADYHKEVAGDCDCRPEDTINWQHAINCEEAAARIEALEAALEEAERVDSKLLVEAAARIEALEAQLQKFDTIAERYWERRCRDEYDENATFRARIEALEAAHTTDIRWAVNVLLEQIASKFEAWDTVDIWRSEAASTVRSFKHDLVPEQDK